MSSYHIELNEIALDSFKDSLYRDFDVTWMAGQDRYDNVYDVLPTERIQPDLDFGGAVEYKYNAQGFRCDDFLSGKSDTLYAGCSQTEGVGGNIEDVWSYMVHSQKFSQDSFFSVARSGYGWQKIIASVMTYIVKYSKPKNILILLPNLLRYWSYEESSGQWRYNQKNPFITLDPDEIDQYRKSVIDFVNGWNLFVYSLKAMEINVLWGTWDHNDAELFKVIFENDESYVHIDKLELEQYILNNSTGKPYEIAKRDGHDGHLVNEYWASKFLERIGQ